VIAYFCICIDGAPTEENLASQIRALHQELARVRPTWVQNVSTSAPSVAAAPTAWSNVSTTPNDFIWILLCGALVMYMQAGFAMLEAGSCRAINVQSIMLKNLFDVCGGSMGWWVFGWAFAYGGPMENGFTKNRFIGGRQFFGSGALQANSDGIQEPDGAFQHSWFFQWAFCAAAATIVSGGVAERVKFPGYLIYSFVMTSFIYPVVVCWTWGYGFLADINDVGYMDFAGSGIVHLTGGIGALVGAIVAKPRNGRFEDPDAFAPHSVPLLVFGTFSLWFGWYGFNCGSTLGMPDAKKGLLAAQVAMNTTLAAAAGGIMVFILKFVLLRKYDVVGLCNGILAGLVSITAPCSTVECGTAVAIGLLGGFIYIGASELLKRLQIDDPIDAFPVHGACGAWGVLAAALFDWGLGFDHVHGWNGFDCVVKKGTSKCLTVAGGQLLAANITQIIVVFAWVGFLTALIFIPLRILGLLVAEKDVQDTGFDSAKHSPPKGYWTPTSKVIQI